MNWMPTTASTPSTIFFPIFCTTGEPCTRTMGSAPGSGGGTSAAFNVSVRLDLRLEPGGFFLATHASYAPCFTGTPVGDPKEKSGETRVKRKSAVNGMEKSRNGVDTVSSE